jgi:hypothetical protein
MHITIKNGTRTPGGAYGLIMGSNTCSYLVESPQIGGFVEGQHEIKSPAWSGKTTGGLLVPSMIYTYVQMYLQDCKLVEIQRFRQNGTRNIVTLLSSLLASMVECMGLSPG